MPEPVWLLCDECDVPYIICAVHNPRKNRYSILPVSKAPDGVLGNFSLQNFEAEVHDAAGINFGLRPVVALGEGLFVTHPPSHFLDEVHADETPHPRHTNLMLPMDED